VRFIGYSEIPLRTAERNWRLRPSVTYFAGGVTAVDLPLPAFLDLSFLLCYPSTLTAPRSGCAGFLFYARWQHSSVTRLIAAQYNSAILLVALAIPQRDHYFICAI